MSRDGSASPPLAGPSSSGRPLTTRPRLGVLIPAHDEAPVIARRLSNLARERWPPGEHRVLVVDDHSGDGTGALARDAIAALDAPCGVRFDVIENAGAPGKARAIRAGLGELEGVDLVVLTDADVVQRPGSLEALVEAFARNPELALACGAQEFVRDLAADGRPLAGGGGEPQPCPGWYDRLTARVRALESRGGVLFSVHGQLLAWRADLGLEPRVGIAADDLDLMFQARALGRRVRLVAGARFLEPKLPAGGGKRDQELRRARAYFQAVHAAPRGPAEGWLARLQRVAYRWLPAVAPEALGLVALLTTVGLFALTRERLGLVPALLGAAVPAALLFGTGAGRRLVHLLGVIRRARASEAELAGDRWGTVRP